MHAGICLGFALASAFGVLVGVGVSTTISAHAATSEGARKRPGPGAAGSTDSREWHDAFIRRFEADPVDPKWGPETETALEADLDGIKGEYGFVVKGVTCHTTSCAANLEWPTYSKAQEGYTRVLAYRFALNCLRDIALPAPPSPSQAPYDARLMFDCASGSASGSTPSPDSAPRRK
jgi:hypothetical protein